ncbi:SF1B family DNA helicase RecD2 [Desulfobacca acetoxidans]|uniref:Helicase, RecD/TraA family n=1 Tax=Desulfobacca acetoxidans (strain ATCC 700848 / DSM 11109 / ASRB2) TaxID=880072 RepID=F2NFN0_DESAR|nr:ATP-dependent RecD-like DNA helicase [Desulfobacca acetoxidans]AEB10149.1 helicase, RecD/TraA family [Desulfobacca acetoxidans DSM 11109]
MLVELQGQIERVTFFSEDTGFVVAQLKVRGQKHLVTIIGHLLAPKAGEGLRLKGEWSLHPKYGEQFKFTEHETMTPATASGMKKYLSSGFIKGIGPVMAQRIVQKFGGQTFDIIETGIERLAEVEGIGPKRRQMIQRAWEEQKQIREVMLFLQTHNISTAYAAKIFKQYGHQAVTVMQENPYQLAADIFGIGFLTADRIAMKLGFEKETPARLEAGILHTLKNVSNEGHVFFPYRPLLEKAREILAVEEQLIVQALSRLAFRQEVVVEESLDQDQRPVYLSGFYLAETNAAKRLKALMQAQQQLPFIEPAKALAWVQERLGLTLAPQQADAVTMSLRHKVLLITGGPGTGKTTIINAILKIWERLGVNVMMAAPTGRAAKRMSEVTGWEAKTIHRLLQYSQQKGGFQVSEGKTLPCDLLIIDEASMIDVVLLHHLLKATPRGATLILVGDANQLPSVGPGNVFRDLIASGTIPLVELTEIFRQAQESLIIVNAHRINRGQLPQWKAEPDKLADFFFLEQEEPQEVLHLVLELVKERIPKRFGFDPVEDIQVLTPMHRGVVGAGMLNQTLQRELNPDGPGLDRGGRMFKVNDKVMQIRNNYDKDVFNGDIGRISRIDQEMQELTIIFENREVIYDFGELDEIVLAYAISVHKSQGSEYPAVVLPMVTQHYLLLQRNLIYTAVTRGKKLVVIVGAKKALAMAIHNDKTKKRHSRLGARLAAG